MTPSEQRLWGRLRANRLAGLHFRRQQVIDGLIADFYCHQIRLIVEVDGPIHDEAAEYDAERDKTLRGRGLRILRVTNEEVDQDLEAVLARIRVVAEEVRNSDRLDPEHLSMEANPR